MAYLETALHCIAPSHFKVPSRGGALKLRGQTALRGSAWCVVVMINMMIMMILCSLTSASTTTCEAQLLSVHCCCYYFFQCSHGGLTRVKLPLAKRRRWPLSFGAWGLGGSYLGNSRVNFYSIFKHGLQCMSLSNKLTSTVIHFSVNSEQALVLVKTTMSFTLPVYFNWQGEFYIVGHHCMSFLFFHTPTK